MSVAAAAAGIGGVEGRPADSERPGDPVDEQHGAGFRWHTGLLDEIWDQLLIRGSMNLKKIKENVAWAGGGGHAWNMYRKEVDRSADRSAAVLARADKWYLEHELAVGVRNGYLVLVGGEYSIGDCPPEHSPLSSVRVAAVAEALDRTDVLGRVERFGILRDDLLSVLLREEEEVALRILRSGGGRIKPVTAMRNVLREELEQFGLADPIVVWEDPAGSELIVVNGRTRMDLLEKMGRSLVERVRTEKVRGDGSVEIGYTWKVLETTVGGVSPAVVFLPRSTPAVEVLRRRISLERAGQSKFDVETGLREYVAELAAEGWNKSRISRALGEAESRVADVLGSPMVKAKMAALKGGGVGGGVGVVRPEWVPVWKELLEVAGADGRVWTQEQIAEYYRVSQPTVLRHVRELNEQLAGKKSGSKSTSNTAAATAAASEHLTGVSAAFLVALYADGEDAGGSTAEDVFVKFGGYHDGRTANKLAERGLIEEVGRGGKRGKARLWWVTAAGKIEAEYQLALATTATTTATAVTSSDSEGGGSTAVTLGAVEEELEEAEEEQPSVHEILQDAEMRQIVIDVLRELGYTVTGPGPGPGVEGK